MTTNEILRVARILIRTGLTITLLLIPFHTIAQTPAPTPAKPAKLKGPLDSLENALEKSTPQVSQKHVSKKKNSPKVQGKKNMPMNMNASSGGGSMSGMMGMMDQMMGQMMGQMSGKQPGMQQPSSELPGYPGASHIYHIGATGYFLDHSKMLALTSEQLKALNQIKERSFLSQASIDRKIEQGEEDLWKLTASDRPEIKSIEAKVKEIETLKSEQRISFIRDVGEAAGILTPEQRSILLGQMPSNSDGMNSMGDM